MLFYEYFHGDNGAGLGASHQTGWTGLVARMIQRSAAATVRAARTCSPTAGRGQRVVASRRHRRRDATVAVATRSIHEINTWAWLHDLTARPGRRSTLADVPGEVWDDGTPRRRRRRVADGRVGAQPGRRRARRSHDADQRGGVPRRAARPHRRRRRRLGVLHPPLRGRRALRRRGRAGRGPGRAGGARRRGCSSTSCPTTWPPTTRGSTEHPEYFVQGTPRTSPRDPASFLAVGDAVHRPGPRPVLPAVAGRRPARTRSPPGCGRPRPTR